MSRDTLNFETALRQEVARKVAGHGRGQDGKAECGSILVCLNSIEREQFFPLNVQEAFRRLSPNIIWVDDLADRDAFLSMVKEVRPRILVGGWSLPRLPDDPSELPSLKYVCYLAGSIKAAVPKQWIESGVVVTNWGSRISRVVAEGALMLILMCLREAGFWTMEMHLRGGWKPPGYALARSLFGRRVGIHGIGSIAQSLIELMAPFGCEIDAYSEEAPAELFERTRCHRAATLEDLFSHCEIVVEAEALTEKTLLTVREKHLRLLGGGVFVNIARGHLVDEAALIKVASEGKLRVGLDVYQQEPLPPDSPFRGLSNVCLSPHIAGPTVDRRRDSGELAVENIDRFFKNRPLEARITPEAYDRMT